MGGNRVLNSLTGIAAAVTVAGLLAGLGTAAGTRPAAAATHTSSAVTAAGVPEGPASPVISATTKLSLRRYVAAGTGAYVVGAENGTFPPIGWHTTGQMGGVWAPPTKLLDGLWFSVGGHWLDAAAKYTTGPGFARLSFPVTGGLRPTLTEFAPDGQPTVLFGLTLTPVSGKATTASVAADAHSQVSAAYPWGSTKPTFDSFNHQNTVSASGGVIQFRQESRPWYAEVGASPQPATVRTGTGFWGPTPASQQTVFGTKGRGGQLTWNLSIPAGGQTLWLGVAGSHTGAPPAVSALKAGLANPLALLAGKVAARDATAALTNVKVPGRQRAADHPVEQAEPGRPTPHHHPGRHQGHQGRDRVSQAAGHPAETVRHRCRLPRLRRVLRHGRRLRDLQPGGRGPVADRHAAPQHAAYRVADRERKHREGRPRDLLHRGGVLRRQHRAR